MTVADLIRVLLDLDQQVMTSRPSPWGEAAVLVAALAGHAERELPGRVLGDWRGVDLSPARRPPLWDLSQPTLSLVQEVSQLRAEVGRLRAAKGGQP